MIQCSRLVGVAGRTAAAEVVGRGPNQARGDVGGAVLGAAGGTDDARRPSPMRLQEAGPRRLLDVAPSRLQQLQTGLLAALDVVELLHLLDAAPPFVLRAYLIRDGALVDSIPLGPRGGGLRRVERVLDMHFFDPRPGPDAASPTAVDVDLIARWLAAHQDRVVAFDPTHHKTAGEVVARLRWFLEGGPLRDPDGAPIRYV